LTNKVKKYNNNKILKTFGQIMERDIFDKIDEEYYNTILDEDFEFNGNIKFEFASIIKGHIEGRIESKDKLVIGPKAVVQADITAKSLECFGKIEGNVVIEDDAYFHAPSILTGSLKSAYLTFEKGCSIIGQVNIKNSGEIKNEI